MKLNSVLPIFLVALVISSAACKKEVLHQSPLIFGHAGTALAEERAVFPPNSEESILYALNALNADGVEADIQLTKDSVLVVYHDPDLSSHTNLSGCINDHNFSEIEAAIYYDNLHILTLSEVFKLTVKNGKRLYMDIKPYNFCAEHYLDFEAFNYAFTQVLTELTFDEKLLVSANCRKFELLNQIEDTVVSKCFETEDIELGINYCQNFGIDKLMIRLSVFDQATKNKLDLLHIPYCVDGLKTTAEIKAAVEFDPYEVITDNIAGTKKMYN